MSSIINELSQEIQKWDCYQQLLNLTCLTGDKIEALGSKGIGQLPHLTDEDTEIQRSDINGLIVRFTA